MQDKLRETEQRRHELEATIHDLNERLRVRLGA